MPDLHELDLGSGAIEGGDDPVDAVAGIAVDALDAPDFETFDEMVADRHSHAPSITVRAAFTWEHLLGNRQQRGDRPLSQRHRYFLVEARRAQAKGSASNVSINERGDVSSRACIPEVDLA
jgi:hypothetical protein